MRFTAVLALLIASSALLTAPAGARDYDPSSHGTYHSSDGSDVHGPTREVVPADGKVTADCRDGTHSYSHHHAGTCSGHHGVANWR